jgi:hypothetical protein
MGANGHSDWPVRQLGEVIELFDHKRVPLNSRERQQRQGQYPYYGAQGALTTLMGTYSMAVIFWLQKTAKI